jgi:PAS domain S-box-containing protein
VRSLSLLGLAVILGILACYVWRARAENALNRSFASLTVTLVGWVLGIGGVESAYGTEFWGRLTFASASLIPAALLNFAREFPTPSRWPSKRIVNVVVYAGVGLAFLSLFSPLVASDISKTATGIQRTTGTLYPLFGGYFLTCSSAALTIFVSKWRSARGLARAQLQYMAIGLVVGSVGGITTNLLIPAVTGRSPYSWLGPYFCLPLLLLVGHAIIRHRLMDLRLVIHHGLVYAVAIAVISGVAILLARVTVFSSSTIVSLDGHVAIATAAVLIMLSSPAQKALRHFIDPYLFRKYPDYSSDLREATHRLTRLIQPIELSDELRQILARTLVPESFTMLARPLEGGSTSLEQIAGDRIDDKDVLTVAALITDESTQSTVVVSPARVSHERRAAHEALRKAGIELVVTLGRRGHTLGTILLGPRRSGDAYFADDLVFVESLAELASIALENSLLFRQGIRMLEYSDRLLESLHSAVVAVDINGAITSSNPAAKAVFGLSDLVRGAPLTILPSEVAWALAFTLLGASHPRETEASVDHLRRGMLPVLLSTAALHDQAGRISGALVVATDLSAVKELERNQRRVEHFALMARFYAGIAHEIRSPLGAISNFISMLSDRFDDPEYRDTASRLLPLEVARIVRLADRLRLMAPSESGKLTPVELSSLLRDIVKIHGPAAHEQKTAIVLHCPQDLPAIMGDPGQVVQLFVNLLKNGIEAMPDGGNLTISASFRPSPASVVVDITDEGQGIDAVVQSKLFQPFFTTKPSGTGLGLAICKEIADFHRAHLSLVNRGIQRGTLARVEFPVASPTDLENLPGTIEHTRELAGSREPSVRGA